MARSTARCAVCNRVIYGIGWFCSVECDVAELDSRAVEQLVKGLRLAAGRAA